MGDLGHADPPWWRSRRPLSILSIVLALVSVASLVAGLVAGRGGGAAEAASGEIFLAPADSPGADTFTPSIAEPRPPVTVPEAVTAPKPSSGGLVQTSAAAPGLYGGTRDAPSCRSAQIVSFLQGDPARARVWAGAIGIDPADIAAYVGSLTPVVTRVDTRVTDFGFRNGRAVPSPAVLQAGTAVLVDRGGLPRVRCASGNPLGAPQPVAATPRYRGPPWPGFQPTTVVVVNPVPVLPAIILVDIRTGAPFTRIPGSIIIIDIDRLAAGVVIAVAEPGGPVTITGTRWPPGAPLTLRFDAPPVVLAAITADGAGNFAVAVNVPPGAVPGVHQVTITGGATTLTTPVYVVTPVPRVAARTAPPR